MKSLGIPAVCASLALLLALHGWAEAATKSEIKGDAILEHTCGKTAAKHMGFVHAGNMKEAVKLGTKEMQKQWDAMPEHDRLGMSIRMNMASLAAADFSAVIKASGLLVIEGPNATLTVKHDNRGADGTVNPTMTQNFKVDGPACRVSL